MKQYANYHKHDHISNIFTPDTHIKCADYIARIKELEYDCYWTTNHGSGGDIFEAKDLCDAAGIRCFYGLEGYIVPNPLDKDARNYHICLIPKTNAARKKLNLATSHASEQGYYYKPRLFLDDLLEIDRNELYVTTACVAGLMRDDDSRQLILEPLIQHFGNNVFIEVQNHNDPKQIEINKIAVEYANRRGLGLIAANDSHYIHPEQAKDRLEFLKGKGINYGDEDSFVLDYPDYDTMFGRFVEQGVLTAKQIEAAIDNTRLFEQCEEISLDKHIKMPTIYPDLSADEKIAELKNHVANKFSVIAKEENIVGDKLREYKDGIKYEMQIIEDTKEINTADYFLLNERIVDLAVNKYGGVLTRTGRGSCGAYYINRILGMTQIDRFASPVKLYPERFMSTARLLENHAMPDIDYNVAAQEPFVDAAKELLGEHMVYPMVAYGTMQLSEAFRNVCRSHSVPYDEVNVVAKDIEQYANDDKWRDIIDEANKYVGTIVSASIHPCAHIMDNVDLREEYGIVKIGDNLCCMITSGEADAWKMLKDDFLIVSVWGILSDVFKLIGRPIMPVKELLAAIDDKVWKLYEDGITCTLNQVDSDYATGLMKKYKAHSVREMAMFTAAVRPSFDSWREEFINRKPFTTGSPQLDSVLAETEGRITFQETLMTYFQWLGVTPAESIGLIKKISKKKIKQADFDNLEARLKEKWIENTGSIDHFEETWQMVQSCMAYGFAAPHALATAIDSLYGAYLKANYPLEYYTVVLGYYEGDEERTKKLTAELRYFCIRLDGVKFRKSRAAYSFDRDTRTIYKSVSSIKYMSRDVAEELYAMRDQQFKNFIDFLFAMQSMQHKPDSRQLDILIKIGYFSEFGKAKALLAGVDVFNKFFKSKTIKLDKWIEMGYNTDILKANAGKYTDKTASQIDNYGLIMAVLRQMKMPATTAIDVARWQCELLGSTDVRDPNADVNDYIVLDVKQTKYAQWLKIYSICFGVERSYKVDKKWVAKHECHAGDVIKAALADRPKYKKLEDGSFAKTGESETVIKCYRVLDKQSSN